MEIIREFFPNDAPILIEGRVTRQRIVDPGSAKLYHIVRRQILPASPLLDYVGALAIAQRLTNKLHGHTGQASTPSSPRD